jgi:hypothetical protein
MKNILMWRRLLKNRYRFDSLVNFYRSYRCIVLTVDLAMGKKAFAQSWVFGQFLNFFGYILVPDWQNEVSDYDKRDLDNRGKYG